MVVVIILMITMVVVVIMMVVAMMVMTMIRAYIGQMMIMKAVMMTITTRQCGDDNFYSNEGGDDYFDANADNNYNDYHKTVRRGKHGRGGDGSATAEV